MPFLKKPNSDYVITCKLLNNQSKLNGFRPHFTFPGDGTYKGEWINDIRNGSGTIYQRNNLIYDGQWKKNLRNGQGSVRKLQKNGIALRIYIGQWKDGMKDGEGKKYYNNGGYYGWWKEDNRSGLGIMWYTNGSIYFGEWLNDTYNGIGVLYRVNGDRYEGNFLCGKKHGEGIYYHNKSGQIQKGMWEKGICKTSIMFDYFCNQAVNPTPFPIHKCTLYNPDELVRSFFRQYMIDYVDHPDSFTGLLCFEIIRKLKKRYQDLRRTSIVTTIEVRN